MKHCKLIISLLLILSIAISAVIPVAADDDGNTEPEEAYSVLGDIDEDGVISIIDCSCLQNHFAELDLLSPDALLRGDVDMDDDTTITDVTHLQRYIAQDDSQTYYVGLLAADAAAAKANDEEAARIAEEQKAQAEKAKQEAAEARYAEAVERAARTRQAMAEYKRRLKEIEAQSGLQKQIEDSIKNYKRQKGVDISEFNGNVDFNKLKAAGYTFVMIRMGFGSNRYDHDDELFEQNVKKAEAAGMPWGAYLYSYALNTTAAESEVRHTLRLLKGKKPTMPVAFDIEDDDYKYSNGMPSDKMLHDICVTYLKGIESAGYYPILYTGYSWLTGALNNKDLTGTYDIWYAQWYTKMEYNTPKVGMWQYGGEVNYLESPYINGLSGPFDKDFCFKNYPVIITAYGYNNHPAKLDRSLAPTSSQQCEDIYTEDDCEDLPPEYNGVMGDSFRRPK